MYKHAFAILLATAAALVFCRCSDDGGQKETLSVCKQYKDLTIDSRHMKTSMKYSVLTPPGFEPSSESYDVLYLLHGYGDDNNAWLSSPQERGGQTSLASRMYRAVQDGVIGKTVVVMPDGQTSFYMGDWENYFHEELMPEVEKRFSIEGRRERRVIAGLSMGGFGSAYHGLKYADKFCAVYTMSMASYDELFQQLANENKDILPSLYVVNGDMDMTVGKAPEGFVAAMEAIGVHCGYESWAGGHDWKFWGECIPKFLDKLGSELRKNK